jgi:hypothetical protein
MTGARDRDAAAGTPQPPMATSFVPHGRQRLPGPTRRFDRRHFARLGSGGAFALTIVATILGPWVATDLGVLPDWSGWRH